MNIESLLHEIEVQKTLAELVAGGYIRSCIEDGQPAYWIDETCKEYIGELGPLPK